MAMRSPRGRAAIALLLATVAAVAACSGGTSEGESPAGAESTPAATPADAASSSPTPASVSGPLADLLPDEVGSIELTKTTVLGPDIGDLDPADAASLAAILENVDGPPEAFSAVNAQGEGINIAAMRMEGTDGRQLGDSFIGEIMQALEGAGRVDDATIGDKEIKRITGPDTDPIHVYVTGEIMFAVQSADPALVEEAFALLP